MKVLIFTRNLPADCNVARSDALKISSAQIMDFGRCQSIAVRHIHGRSETLVRTTRDDEYVQMESKRAELEERCLVTRCAWLVAPAAELSSL